MTDPNADLADIRTKWLAFCSHDLDLPYPCICPTEDHRPVIAALVGEVEGLRAEVARLRAERLPEWESDLLISQALTERDQARADLAALHAEAARLATDRDKAHALVDELMAERNVALDERDAMRPVVEAASAWRDQFGEFGPVI
jgi:hypothetical protein